MKFIKVKYLNAILIALSVIVLQSNIFAQNRTEFIVVADEMSNCKNSRNEKCLQIRKPHETNWRNLQGRIVNFKYQPEFFYLLEVRKIDGGNLQNNEYSLVKILYRVKTTNKVDRDSILGNGRWVLHKINGVNVNTNRAFVRFEENKNRFGGNGGCNGMGGDLSVKDSMVDMSQIISTKMFCEGTSEIENQFFNELEKAERFEIRGKNLIIYNGKRPTLELKSEN